MSDLFESFVRKQFPVEAVRVDPLNIKEVAAACHGQIRHDGSKENQFSRDYIKVRVLLPLNDEQTKARIGDWVVRQGRSFKVYKDSAFRKTFEYPDGTNVLSDFQREKAKKDEAQPELPLETDSEKVDSKDAKDTEAKPVTLDELNKQ